MMGKSIQNALDSYSRGGSEHSFYDDDGSYGGYDDDGDDDGDDSGNDDENNGD